MAAKVYLDTNVFKFAATALPRTRRVFTGVNWGGHRQIAEVHQPIVVNPNEKIAAGSELKAEVELLPKVAHLAHEGVIVLAISVETQVELSGIPGLDSMTEDLYNAPRITVEPPIRYGRVLFGGTEDFREAQFSFIESLGDSRFLELRRACGAQQGKKVNRNQLLDAFHLWCAEHNACEYFLSLDFKLARVIDAGKIKPTCRIVRPSELLSLLAQGHTDSI